MTLFSSGFTTSDPELAENLIRSAYTDQRSSLSGNAAEFGFEHHSEGVIGPGSLSIDRTDHSMDPRFVA